MVNVTALPPGREPNLLTALGGTRRFLLTVAPSAGFIAASRVAFKLF
jgi:hypothetical protein